MIFHPAKLLGVFRIEIEPQVDNRGFFARSWCQREFEQNGLNPKLVQCSLSYNARKGTLRGLHYQADPHPETKLVRCTNGAIYDVVVDLRRDSPTFQKWDGFVLTRESRDMVYVAPGCAHGFLTLEDSTEVSYQMSEFYHSDLARGVRWNDPAFQIQWPGDAQVISEKDQSYPDF
jgi:dTDP-4-dehydrorhamnose 3,5-epimerase